MLFNNDLNHELLITCYVSNSKALGMHDRNVLSTIEYFAKHFLKLSSIHGYFNRHYVCIYTPLVFDWLKNKSTKTFFLEF